MSDWIEWKWTPEKPYPETLRKRIDVRFRDGKESIHTWWVGFWHSSSQEDSNWFNSKDKSDDDQFEERITHYRIAED